MKHIDKGFKYLGYFLRPTNYGTKDWRWLVKRFKKKISLWSYRLLTLGSIITHIKAVLTGLPIYWFSLAKIPKAILNHLRQCIFSFLWGSCDGRSKMHLVDWKTLSFAVDYGWRDIKKLECFGTSLRIKSCWYVINNIGLWSHIIKAKYLKK